MTAAERAVEVELNGIGDNPMVLIERDTMISNGNFQPMQLALAFDALRTGAAHVAMISERRMNKLMTIRFSDPEAHAGGPERRGDGRAAARRALVQYAAAGLLAELKHLAAPVSIHLPPLDLDVEDHGTVAPSVVFTTRRALALLDTILTCEAQMAIDLMDVQGVPAWAPARARPTSACAACLVEGSPPNAGRPARSSSRPRAPRCASGCMTRTGLTCTS